MRFHDYEEGAKHQPKCTNLSYGERIEQQHLNAAI